MSKAFRIVLMVCAVVLVLAVSGSMIYYFAFAKPANERAELEWEKEKQEKEEQQKNAEEARDILAELERERKLFDCLDKAYENYIDAWNEQAERLDSKDGFLPGVTADKLNESYEKAKEECFRLYGPD